VIVVNDVEKDDRVVYKRAALNARLPIADTLPLPGRSTRWRVFLIYSADADVFDHEELG